MPGRLHKSMVYLGLVDDDEREYDEHDDYDEVPADHRPPSRSAPRREERTGVRTVEPRERTQVNAVSFDHGSFESGSFEGDEPRSRQEPAPRLSRITTLHPRNYNDARAIGEQFRANVPVVMDLTEMDDADAKRLVDFAAGLTFGLRGRIEKVTRGVFLLSPEGVAVTLDSKTGVVEGGFYNQS